MNQTRRGFDSHKTHWISVSGEPTVEILESGESLHGWAEAERRWISHFRNAGSRLTNATDGGDGTPGFYPGTETRKKMSAAHVGRKMPPESIAKTAAALRGRKQSPAHIAALAATRKGKIPMAATEAAAKWWLGRKQSAEHVQKRIAAHIGVPRPELHRLTEEQAIFAKNSGMSLRATAKILGVGVTTIFEIRKGKVYAARENAGRERIWFSPHCLEPMSLFGGFQ
jgi:hypothetical protein